MACGIQFPDQGSNLGPLHWEHGVLATGPLRKSLVHLLTHMFCLGYFCVLRPGLSQLLGPDVGRLTMGAFLTSVFILEVSCRSRPGWACFFFSVHITQHRLDTEKVPVSVGEVNDQKKVGVIIEKEGLAPPPNKTQNLNQYGRFENQERLTQICLHSPRRRMGTRGHCWHQISSSP